MGGPERPGDEFDDPVQPDPGPGGCVLARPARFFPNIDSMAILVFGQILQWGRHSRRPPGSPGLLIPRHGSVVWRCIPPTAFQLQRATEVRRPGSQKQCPERQNGHGVSPRR
ncbi:MAG: hypothetical protein MJE68_13755 [Proteobacteria bacterium]|nr:hypothetical protein [Pseudomonadota bacterium]